LKKYIRDYAFLFLFAGVVILLDQWTKSLVRANLAENEIYRYDLWITQYARIINIHNTGAAFGLFQRFGGVFTILSFIVSGVILYYFPQVPRSDWILRVALSLQLSGAVGNLIDRLHQGYVTDFISIGNFPVFNVADASISTGVAVLVVVMWLRDRHKPPEADETAAPEVGKTLPEDPRGE
jgi:signal peptidase II